MRFLKGKSPRKELNLEFFRAAGAPILEFFDHNPKFVKKGGVSNPPLYSEPIWPDLVRRGGRILLIVLIVLNFFGRILNYF